MAPAWVLSKLKPVLLAKTVGPNDGFKVATKETLGKQRK
jgi:hypothetical protein